MGRTQSHDLLLVECPGGLSEHWEKPEHTKSRAFLLSQVLLCPQKPWTHQEHTLHAVLGRAPSRGALGATRSPSHVLTGRSRVFSVSLRAILPKRQCAALLCRPRPGLSVKRLQ